MEQRLSGRADRPERAATEGRPTQIQVVPDAEDHWSPSPAALTPAQRIREAAAAVRARDRSSETALGALIDEATALYYSLAAVEWQRRQGGRISEFVAGEDGAATAAPAARLAPLPDRATDREIATHLGEEVGVFLEGPPVRCSSTPDWGTTDAADCASLASGREGQWQKLEFRVEQASTDLSKLAAEIRAHIVAARKNGATSSSAMSAEPFLLPPGWDRLALRERHVAYLLSRGHSDPEIAEELGVTLNTARKYSAITREKLGHSSRRRIPRDLPPPQSV